MEITTRALNTPKNTIIGILLFVSVTLSLLTPFFASAQTPPAASGGVLSTLGTALSNVATGAANGPGGTNPQPTVCDGGWRASINPTCWFRVTVAALSSVLIQIAIWILSVSGMLFNLLVDHTIINFGKFLYSDNIKNAVETAWTAFRDISNIVIIGMFVFVAINIILGNQTYGERKMVAKIIVIAVLINFSLLFTKVIIDFSNFSALQFYNAAQLQATNPNAAAAAGATANTVDQKGIAGAFLDYMGVTGIGDSYAAVRATAEANDSGGYALLQGIAASVFLLAAAMVLFYGSFLLASRAILLIFLILTSSIAFATYLIPIKVVNTNFGWGQWWSSLLRSAVFAPLLMILLWVTLAVGKAIKVKTGTLGDLFSHPSNTGNLDAFFGYIIVLGLLYISFKISSSFSASIGGFNYAAMIPAGIAGAGSQFFSAVGRTTIGRLGNRFGEEFGARARNLDGGTRSEFTRNLYSNFAKPFQAAAKADFNTMNSRLGGMTRDAMVKNLKGTGMTAKTLTGPKVGGFAGEEAARAKAEIAKEKRTSQASQKEIDDFKAAELKAATTLERPAAAPLKDSADQAEAPKDRAEQKKDEENVRAEALKEALAAAPQKDRDDHAKATQQIDLSEKTVSRLRGENAQEIEGLKTAMKGMQQQVVTLRGNKDDVKSQEKAESIEKEIRQARTETARHLKERNQSIREANSKAKEASHEKGEIEKRLTSATKKMTEIREDESEKQKTASATMSRSVTGTLKKWTATAALAMKPVTTAQGNFERLKKTTAKKVAQEERLAQQAKARKKLDDEAAPKSEPAPEKEGKDSH